MIETRGTTPRAVLSTLGGMVLGAVLLLGAATKVLDPRAFVETIRGEGLDFLVSAVGVAGIAFALEAGLGTALLLGVRRRWVLVPAAGLVVFFLVLTGRAWWRSVNGTLGEEAGCGCFGNLVERTPAEAFVQDSLLLVPALLLAFLARPGGPFPWRRLAVAAAASAATLGLAAKAPELPLDDLATRLRPGKEIAGFCAGGTGDRVCLPTVAPEMATGEHLVVIADLADEAFGAAVPALNQAVLSGTPLVVLAAASYEERNTFFWRHGPSFDILEAPKPMLRPLYRRLPRSFRVRSGRVIETFTGLPPLPEVAHAAPPPSATATES